MMPNAHPEELLSAYLDGELSPVETQHVERLLDEDPSLRERLRELSELSVAIRRLPKLVAPADLQPAILASLPETPLQSQTTERFNPRRRSRLYWRTAIAACVVGGLFVGTMLNPLARQPAELNSDFKLVETAKAMQGRFELQSVVDKMALPGTAPVQPSPSVLASAPSMPAVAMQAERALPVTSQTIDATVPAEQKLITTANPKDSRQAEPQVPVVALTSDQLRMKIMEAGRLPESGHSIQIPSEMTTADGVLPIMVEFTVVDTKLAMNQLQVLVQKRQMRTLDNHVVTRPAGAAREAELSSISLELELDGPEMATVLNHVPALDAVLYLPELHAQSESLGDTASAKTQNFSTKLPLSRAAISAKPEATASQIGSQVATVRRRFEQPVQFRFDQLSQVQSPLADEPQDALSSKQQTSMTENSATSESAQIPMFGTSGALPQTQMIPQFPQNSRAIELRGMPQARQAAPKIRATILLQPSE